MCLKKFSILFSFESVRIACCSYTVNKFVIFESHQCFAGVWKRRLGCHVGCQEVGRCHTTGKSQGCIPLPSTNKAAHSEMLPKVQNRGISGPTKRIYILQIFFKQNCINLQNELTSMRSLTPWSSEAY